MKVTSIRRQSNNSKLTTDQLERLCEHIVHENARDGFITEAYVVNSTSIKIGQHMRTFSIDTLKLGSNARIGHYVSSPKGYKRTNVPTWDQRVEFNDTVNMIFNKLGLKATIKSGSFSVRDKNDGAFTESHWENQTENAYGDQYNGMGQLCSAIRTEADAREEMDSDRLEAEHEAKMKPLRLEGARIRRAKLKQFESAKKVTVAGLSGNYSKKLGYVQNKMNGRQVTHSQFGSILSKLSYWESRKVRKESIEATSKPKLELLQGGAA